MHEYRHVIHRMRLGESDRAIARSGLMGRLKCTRLREVASGHGWLGDGPLPEDRQIAEVFKAPLPANPTRQSLSRVHEDWIRCRFLRSLTGPHWPPLTPAPRASCARPLSLRSMELDSCRFIEEKVCVLIVGPCGTGKSHIA